MSHHCSGPNIGFPRGDARLDLTDLYAFPKPGDPNKSILIMNVHPSVGLNPHQREGAGDNVGPHDDFLDEFPYLGPPHIVRSASKTTDEMKARK
jgi:hypothetical protein